MRGMSVLRSDPELAACIAGLLVAGLFTGVGFWLHLHGDSTTAGVFAVVAMLAAAVVIGTAVVKIAGGQDVDDRGGL